MQPVPQLGAVKTRGFDAYTASQFVTLSFTFIKYEPAVKVENTLFACQVAPLSLENSKLEPLAVTLIVPLLSVGQLDTEGSPLATRLMMGVAGGALITVALAVDTQLLVLSFTTT
jgi:hypothetical protein